MTRFKLTQRTSLPSALLLFLLANGCSGGATSDASDTAGGASSAGGSGPAVSGTIEVVTQWNGKDSAAMERARAVFMDKNPSVTVDVKIIDGGWSGLDDTFDKRLAKALPMPALVQKSSPDSTQRWNAAGELTDLTNMYAEKEPKAEGGKAWQDVIPESILAASREDGKYIAVTTNLSRTNSIFYNKKLFEENGLSPPKTIQEFKDLVIKLKTDVDLNGGAPLIIGNVYSWTLQLFLMSCLGVPLMGADEYTHYFSGEMEAENAKFKEVLELGLFMRCGSDPETKCDGFLNEDLDTLDHGPSIDAFIAGYEDGKPKFAMAPAGDWVKSWMKDGGLVPGVDFDSFACPVLKKGDVPVFTGGADAFLMPTRATNPEAALAFTRFLGSKDGQLAINEKKGTIPVRTDINLADYPEIFDAIQVRTYADFQTSRYFVESWKPGALSDMGGQLKSLSTGSIDIAYNYVKNNYATLKY